MPEIEDVKDPVWIRSMEAKFAAMYNEGLEREELFNRGQYASFNKRRRKRYVIDGLSTIQVGLMFMNSLLVYLFHLTLLSSCNLIMVLTWAMSTVVGSCLYKTFLKRTQY